MINAQQYSKILWCVTALRITVGRKWDNFLHLSEFHFYIKSYEFWSEELGERERFIIKRKRAIACALIQSYIHLYKNLSIYIILYIFICIHLYIHIYVYICIYMSYMRVLCYVMSCIYIHTYKHVEKLLTAINKPNPGLTNVALHLFFILILW